MEEADDLRELFAAAHRRLVIAVAGVTGDLGEAEECVAEAFARAVPRWGRLSSYDDPEAWIRRVAVNIARSRWRAAQRALARSGRSNEVPPLSENHVALMAALQQLPADQREAIVLHHLVDLSVQEVAIHQQAPIGTVKARLARGRQALAQLLAWDDEEVQA